MNTQTGTREYLIDELVEMRQRIAGLEKADTERKRAEEELEKHRKHLEELVNKRTAELQKEITKRKRVEEQLKELSITDDLTGLYNRRRFYETLESEVQRTLRYGQSFSLIMLDLDEFNEYNDRFGHTSGDIVLKSFANALKSTLRKSDISFRYGGDEFAIILPVTDANRAKKIIERVRAKWVQKTESQYPILEAPLGFSAGIAQFPEDAATADGLLFLANSAHYHIKR